MNDNEIRELVQNLTITAIAYMHTGQLRGRIAEIIVPVLAAENAEVEQHKAASEYYYAERSKESRRLDWMIANRQHGEIHFMDSRSMIDESIKAEGEKT